MRVHLLAGAIALAGLGSAQAFTIDLSTGHAAWQASYAGGAGAAKVYDCGGAGPPACISISSTGFVWGEFVGGGSAADFDGVWQATLDFELPATQVDQPFRIDLEVLGVDDRAEISLNDWLLGHAYLNGGLRLSQSVPGMFLHGQNRLTVRVVNNPVFANGAPMPFNSFLDGTALSMRASVSAVPEPESYLLMIAGLGLLGRLTGRRGVGRR